MTEADKLFEELGYKKIDSDKIKHTRFIRQVNKTTRENIDFHKIFKTVEVYFYDFEDHQELTKPISMEEIKAINLKCKELGWIEE